MVEYGGAIRNSGNASGSRGSFDVGDDVIGVISDLFERIASLPPEILLLIGGILVVGLFYVSRGRTV